MPLDMIIKKEYKLVICIINKVFFRYKISFTINVLKLILKSGPQSGKRFK